jgi:hypothetical protein
MWVPVCEQKGVSVELVVKQCEIRPRATHKGAISRRVRLLSELMFTISESIRCTPTEDGCIVLDTRHGQILSLNVVGSRIFGLVQRGFNQAQIADEISRDFQMSLQIVRADVFDFLANLQKHKILQPCRTDGVL